MANNTPRDRGIVDEAYAVRKAAELLDDKVQLAFIDELIQSITEQSLPLVTGWYYKSKVEGIAADQATVLGYNPLDQVDDIGVGTAEQNAVVGGDVGANLSALANDVVESAKDRGQELASAASISWKVILAVVIVAAVAYAIARGRT